MPIKRRADTKVNVMLRVPKAVARDMRIGAARCELRVSAYIEMLVRRDTQGAA